MWVQISNIFFYEIPAAFWRFFDARRIFKKIPPKKSSNESIQMNLMVDMDDCKDAFKVFDPENPVKDVRITRLD